MKRFWEIDALRGLAVILMIIFNYSFTLRFLEIYTVNAGWQYWWLFPRIIAGMFIFLVGVSLSLSYNRKRNYIHFLKRGAFIFSLGMLATLATWLYIGKGFVVFGILHLIGLSVILAPFFFRFGKLNAIISLVIFIFGFYINSLPSENYWLLWLGFVPSDFYSVDYFPLLPWFGLVLIGFGVGNRLYSKSKRMFKINDYSNNFFIKKLSFLGRHSLMIYVLHQPVLLAFLYLFGFL